MTHTRKIATAAAVTLLAGLGTVTTTAASQAQTDQAASRATKYEVTAKVSTTEPEKGDKVTIRGSVTPATPGAEVVLQKRDGAGEKWKKVETDTLNNRSRFKFTQKVRSVGVRQYRVLKAADRAASAGRSEKIGVTVYVWRDLTSLSPVTASATTETGFVTINATKYKRSIVGSMSNSGAIAYNIDRGCKRFDGRFGLSDDSAITSRGQISLLGDTRTLFYYSFGLTESMPADLDLTGVFRLTVDWTSINSAGTPENQSGAIIAVGSPRLLCSF